MAARKRALVVSAYVSRVGSEIEVRLTNGWDRSVLLGTFTSATEAAEFADNINSVIETAGTKVPA